MASSLPSAKDPGAELPKLPASLLQPIGLSEPPAPPTKRAGASAIDGLSRQLEDAERALQGKPSAFLFSGYAANEVDNGLGIHGMELPERGFLPPSPPRLRPRVRLSRLVMLLLPGIMILLGFRWYVLTTAQMKIPQKDVAIAPAKTLPEVEVSPFAEVEEELRTRLLGGVQPLSSTTSLEDALQIDIQRMRIRVERVQADSIVWAGRHLEQPKSAEIAVYISSVGEIDRELAGVSMVVGQYMERYYMEVPKFKVVLLTEQGSYASQIDAPKAHKLYLNQLGMADFLESMTD